MPKTGFYSDGYFNNSESPVNTPLQSYTRVNKNNTTTVFQNVITLSESQDDGVTRAYYKSGHILSQANQSTLFNITTSTGVHSIENFSFKINSNSTISGVVANTGIDTFSNIFINFEKIAANKFTNGIRASSEGVSLDSYPISSVEPLSAGLPFDSKYFLTYKGIFSTLFCVEKVWRNGRPARGVYGLTHDEAFIKSIPLGEITTTDGTHYYVDGFTNRIRKITPQGVMSTIAGTSSIPVSSINDFSRSVDGVGAEAVFSNPRGVAINSTNTVLIVVDSHCLRQVPVDGSASVGVYAGTLGVSGAEDGPLNVAKFNNPHGIINYNNQCFYVADTGNHAIRCIANGYTSTMYGVLGLSGLVTGPLGFARFNHPYDLVCDTYGNVFVTDYGNNCIRKITPDESVYNFVGSDQGVPGYIDDTGTNARFNGPKKITIDNNNNLYVVDSNNYVIRKITPQGVVTTINTQTQDTNINDNTPLNFGVTVSSANWIDLNTALWCSISTTNLFSDVSCTPHPLYTDPLKQIHYDTPRESLSFNTSVNLNRLSSVVISRELNWKNVLPPKVYNTYSSTTLSGLTLLNYYASDFIQDNQRYCFYNKGVSGTDFRDGVFYTFGRPGIGVTKWNRLYKHNRLTTGIANIDNDYLAITTQYVADNIGNLIDCLSATGNINAKKLTLYVDGKPLNKQYSTNSFDNFTLTPIDGGLDGIETTTISPTSTDMNWYTYLNDGDNTTFYTQTGVCVIVHVPIAKGFLTGVRRFTLGNSLSS